MARRPARALPSSEPQQRARQVALRFLAARARTEGEVRARLSRAGLGDEADGVVRWLRGLGYVDDEAFAGARSRALLAPGRLGPREVERRLVKAGLSAELAQSAVGRALRGEDGRPLALAERELCRALAERRARRPLGALDERERGRLARFLLGRGFSAAAVAAVLGLSMEGG